jgi:hypothetical protein
LYQSVCAAYDGAFSVLGPAADESASVSGASVALTRSGIDSSPAWAAAASSIRAGKKMLERRTVMLPQPGLALLPVNRALRIYLPENPYL